MSPRTYRRHSRSFQSGSSDGGSTSRAHDTSDHSPNKHEEPTSPTSSAGCQKIATVVRATCKDYSSDSDILHTGNTFRPQGLAMFPSALKYLDARAADLRGPRSCELPMMINFYPTWLDIDASCRLPYLDQKETEMHPCSFLRTRQRWHLTNRIGPRATTLRR